MAIFKVCGKCKYVERDCEKYEIICKNKEQKVKPYDKACKTFKINNIETGIEK
jgi:hypothetical protein